MTDIHWDALTEETVNNLSRLIQAKTINPPGYEAPAIQIIQDILEREGFPQDSFTIVESVPGRGNLIARLKGDGTQRPLLLSGHVDVVPVEPEYWTHDPFGGEVIDGVIWGRGALDMKGDVAKYLAIFLLAHRLKLPLKRDLIFAAIADEEAGMVHGSQFLVEKHADLIDAEYGLTESGGMTVHMSGARLYPLQVAEKGICWLHASTKGRPGHGSMPHTENAVLRLASALERLRRAGHLPVHLTPPVEGMLTVMSQHLPAPLNILVGFMRNPTLAGFLLNRLPEEQRGLFFALLSNSVSATMLQAGSKHNVIPSSAEASLDCRLLPGQTPEDAMRELYQVMGKEIELTPVFASSGVSVPMDTLLYKMMENAIQRMDPGAGIMPTLMPGGTDARQYFRAGIKVYGFTPGILPPDLPMLRLAHGHDERIPVSSIRSGLPALWEVVSEFCTGSAN